MYLLTLKIWNFRKYGANGNDPGLVVEFKDGLNVLVGENDSGKTAIIDAIRFALNTKSFEQPRIDEKDFFKSGDAPRSTEFDIECLFAGMAPEEAANFIEWAHFNENKDYELRVHAKARRINNRITFDVKAGPINAETQMDANARELLKVTYLKPLRDAEQELTPGYRSRLAQILLGHEDFKKKIDEHGHLQQHPFETIIENANKEITEVLNQEDQKVISSISKYVKLFLHSDDQRKPELRITNPELQRILRTLSLELEENNSGLGTLNKLFMAAELLHLETEQYNGLKLCLIEEIEAHLHPQAQLRVIKALQENINTQIILSTHSTTLGSSIKLEHLILCHGDDVYPLWKGKTELAGESYKFLERFLDATKANLLFARGVILVEGDAENILIPTIAELIGRPLHKHGVSIVNVGSTAFLHYANIFKRRDGKDLKLPVAVITDLDVRPIEYYENLVTEGADSSIINYYVLDSSIRFEGEDLSPLYGIVYTSKDELKDAVRELLKIKRLPNGLGSAIDELSPAQLTDEVLNSYRESRRIRIEKRFTSDNVKVFTNKKWTLEYDIALSKGLREYLAKAVKIAERLKQSKAIDLFYDEEELQTEINEILNSDTDEEIAYKIFEPFTKKNSPSKAITAQLFAESIAKNKENWIKNGSENGTDKEYLLTQDDSLSYIVNAIEHVCNQQR